ncbi:MAG: CC/Se motif family (seleno)protein [Bacillota bacterium]
MKPAVFAGQPTDIENFNSVDTEGLTVYVPKEEGNDKSIKIDVMGFGPFKQIIIEGF